MIALDQLSRVVILGTSCSGKTTFASALADTLKAPHIELDALHWGPNWTPNPPDQFRAAVDQATSQLRWVCDGNYRMVRDLVWPRASSIIWLNYRFPLVFKRASLRTFGRCFRQTRVYAGNQETFFHSFLSRDSIILWVLRSHWGLRREYLEALHSSKCEHAQIIQLNSAPQAAQFLNAVQQLASIQSPIRSDPN